MNPNESTSPSWSLKDQDESDARQLVSSFNVRNTLRGWVGVDLNETQADMEFISAISSYDRDQLALFQLWLARWRHGGDSNPFR